MKVSSRIYIAIGLIFTFSEVTYADLNDGLLSYWSFDACSASDDSGNGNDGVIYGNPACVEGIRGNAFLFDGQNDYIRVENFIIPIRDQLSVCVWAKPFPGVPADIISKHANANDLEILMNVAQDGKYDSVWNIGGEFQNLSVEILGDPNPFSGLVEPSYDSYDLLVGTYNGNQLSFYFNGELFVTKNVSGDIATNSFPLTIGANAWNPAVSRYEGYIDEIRIYNRGLSTEEICQLHHDPVPEVCDNELDDDCDGFIDDSDPDCQGYSSAANAEASSYGSSSLAGSGIVNEMVLLLIPMGAVVFLRCRKR